MRTVFIIALFFLAPACGPVNHPDIDAGLPTEDAALPDVSPDAGTPSDASVDAPPTPDASVDAPIDIHTPEGFARREGEILCGAWSECAGCDIPVRPTCVEDRVESSLTANDPLRFRPDQVDAYFAALEEASALCQMLSTREFSELFPYRGDGQPPSGDALGDVCYEHEDCITRNCEPYVEPGGGVFGNRCTYLPASTDRGALCG